MDLLYFSHKEATNKRDPWVKIPKREQWSHIHECLFKACVPGRHLRGMRQLESKISDLQNQYQSLLKERQEDITTIIVSLDLAFLEDQFLIGGLLFIKEKVTEKDPTELALMEVWRDAGEKFLRRTKSKTYPRSCEYKGKKQAEVYPQPREQEGRKQGEVSSRIPSGNNTSPKQTATPQAAHQLPQKQPQPGEE